ncbi:hypothetical protein CAEBREN_11853 [Caenorhabditis brenneri]|uniref:Uncharacterized protein n=1 Tax=Caenorhabditis brenneri TaxID=135651 RepID=G0MWA9_CAEBE|nr:hypothetical protein CAEBREN_11853 [Caenorhabditis brenneri]
MDDKGTDEAKFVETNKTLRIRIANYKERKKCQTNEKKVTAEKINQQISTPTLFECNSNGDGVVISNPDDVREMVKVFYENLYKSSAQVVLRESQITDNAPEVIETELNYNLKRTKLSRAPGHDQVTNSMLRNSMPSIVSHLQEVFNHVMDEKQIPPAFANSMTTLTLKKSDLGRQ